MICEECIDYPDKKCWLHDKDDEHAVDVVIFDPEKKAFHVLNEELYEKAVGNPLTGIGWEPVFVDNNRIISDVQKLKGFVRAGPYYVLFMDSSGSDKLISTPVPRVRSSLELSLLDTLPLEMNGCFSDSYSLRETIDRQIERVSRAVTVHISQTIPELSKEKTQVISEILAHRATAVGPLIPFLLMEKTEELFLDRPGSALYFDHQEFGRCSTEVIIGQDLVPRLVTLIRSETNLHLDRSNPSLKADIKLLGVPLRISASIGPLSPDGFHLEIRRARTSPFTLQDLIANSTITHEVAAILLLALASRFNITITGGPGTGKTTLLNALDMTTPDWWRKIYIEDASESRVITNHHQVRLSVDPVDERIRSSSKEEEIIKSLHRSPDYLILGEIQTKQHSEALFQAVAAGLKVMQTCHSNSASGLISRWRVAHNIAESSICQMDFIVTLERPRPGESKRVVSEIVEVCKTDNDGILKFEGLNRIYSIVEGMTNEWSPNGAFLAMAKSLGLRSHETALAKLILLLKDENNLEFETIPSLLWEASHPVAYSG